LLRSGEMELITTSLPDEIKYPSIIFKVLYFKRWSIETLYDKLKNKLLVYQNSEMNLLQMLKSAKQVRGQANSAGRFDYFNSLISGLVLTPSSQQF